KPLVLALFEAVFVGGQALGFPKTFVEVGRAVESDLVGDLGNWGIRLDQKVLGQVDALGADKFSGGPPGDGMEFIVQLGAAHQHELGKLFTGKGGIEDMLVQYILEPL